MMKQSIIFCHCKEKSWQSAPKITTKKEAVGESPTASKLDGIVNTREPSPVLVCYCVFFFLPHRKSCIAPAIVSGSEKSKKVIVTKIFL